MREIKRLIVHCSASTFGSAALIDSWHKEYGWKGIGYHYVIENGRRASRGSYNKSFDGHLEKGREIMKIGAHTKGHNRDSIGICLIGKYHFSYNQLFVALPNLLDFLGDAYNLRRASIHGHNEYSRKACPSFWVGNYLTNLHRR